jgi:putative oxidoreductase
MNYLTLPGLDRWRWLGVLVLRLFTAGVLIYGVHGHLFGAEKMREFEQFLAESGVPQPVVGAHLCVYAQFLCGLLLLAGAAARWAAAIMVVNFIAALFIAHLGAPFMRNIAPLAMLSCSLFFLLHGAGPPSVDDLIARRAAAKR